MKTDTIEAVGVATPNLAAAQADGAKAKSAGASFAGIERRPAIQSFLRFGEPELAEEICKHIGVTLGETRMQRFSDGEVYFQLLENVRGADVFVVQPTCWPVDQHLVELLIMIDALKRASAGRITVVVPYYGYARQDRKDRPRVAISSKLVADLMTTAGAHRALFMDLHAAQIQGFFNIPVDHLFASPVMIGYFRETESAGSDGGFARCRRRGARAAYRDQAGRAHGDRGQAAHGHQRHRSDERDRRRVGTDVPDRRRHHRHGRHAGEDGGHAAGERRDPRSMRGLRTLCSRARPLSALPIRSWSSFLLQIRSRCALRRSQLKDEGKIKVLSVAGLLGAAILSIHMETSVSTLFN